MLTMKEFRETLVEMMERKGASPKVRQAFLEALAAHEASIECARQRDVLAAALKYIEQKGRAKISDDDWNDVAYTAFDALREAGMEA